MFKKLSLIILVISLSSSDTFSQLKKLSYPNMRSEAEIYIDNEGNWYSTSVTVKFAKRTIDLQRGLKDAAFSDILIPETIGILKKVEKKYGKFAFEKLFPDASYDDVYGMNIVTKEKVRLKDESQFYKLIFKQRICIDSLINELKGLPNIVSAERPFIAVTTYTPNDYSASEQWALSKIEVTNAWDITHGSDQVKIALNDAFDNTNIAYLHEELRDGKVVYNPNNYCQGHGQLVAGCTGALTDNGSGIASVGFNVKLMFTDWGPDGIAEARDNGAHIINPKNSIESDKLG